MLEAGIALVVSVTAVPATFLIHSVETPGGYVNDRIILLGNEAIAYGLVESSCTVATSYPGTPASEILGTLIRLREECGLKLHLEWSINEKVAFEVALANSIAGRRSGVIMKQVGLNVAADPLMSAAYTGIKGGFIIIAADDPGPHSSQTEQDSRFYAMMAKVPVLDPCSPAEARSLIPEAIKLSEQYEIPVMLRPTTRVCHARQDLTPLTIVDKPQSPFFEKDPTRWAATPKFRFLLHRHLNEKIERIAESSIFSPRLANRIENGGRPSEELKTSSEACIVASGVAFAHAQEILADLELEEKIPLYQIVMPYPLDLRFRDRLLAKYRRILILEETQPVIEFQFQNRTNVFGRTTGSVPKEGELLPEVVEEIIRKFLDLSPAQLPSPPQVPGRRPTLCAGCPHRAAFYAIRKTFPKGIYPGDIGCYTLGLNLGAVDSVLCMGASIGFASGFYHAYGNDGESPPIIAATIGDSTFFHAGIPALVNAVTQGSRFVLVVLDNSTTAMTGHQPTPASGVSTNGKRVPKISIKDLAKASGVAFVEEEDPYAVPQFMDLLKRAGKHVRDPDGGVAVVISKRPCLMDRKQPASWAPRKIRVTEKCKGCDYCIQHFECPALKATAEKDPIQIDEGLCSGCSVCVHVCPNKALEVMEREE